MLSQIICVQWQISGQILRKDICGTLSIRTLNLDLHVQPAWSKDCWIDHVLAVGCPDHDDVLEPLDAIDLAEKLRHDGVLDIT